MSTSTERLNSPLLADRVEQELEQRPADAELEVASAEREARLVGNVDSPSPSNDASVLRGVSLLDFVRTQITCRVTQNLKRSVRWSYNRRSDVAIPGLLVDASWRDSESHPVWSEIAPT